MRRFSVSTTLTLLLTLLSISLVAAQGTCSAIIDEALESVDANCEGLDRNEACYGYDLVQAAFVSEVPDDYFAEASDIAGILELETIATSGLDETNNLWGVAVMNIQADLPNTLPGQNVTMVLMGDTEVENAVEPDLVFTPSDGIDVTVTANAGANIRSGAGLNFNVVGAAANNETLQADGMSQDTEWLRIVYRNRPAWISRTVIVDDSAIDDLPVLTSELRTPMQAFFLRTGIGEPACEEAPDDMLVVQGPDHIDVEFEVNGTSIVIGSTVGLRVVEFNREQFLELFVLDGEARVRDVTVRPGYRTLMCLGEPDNRGVDGEANDRLVSCDPTPPERVDDFGEQFCVLERIPPGLLNYNIDVLCPGETPPASSGGSPASQSQIPEVDCSNFALIGPLSGITPRPTQFSWTPAPGADQYEVVFHNPSGPVLPTIWTSETSTVINVGEIPTGSELAWEVRAYRGGAYACVTGRTPFTLRQADPNPPPPPSDGNTNTAPTNNFTASLVRCAPSPNGSTAAIQWSGAGASAVVTVSAVGGSTGNGYSTSGNGDSGTVSLTATGETLSNIVASSSTGGSVSLGKC